MEYLTDEHYAIAEKNGLKKHTVYQRVNEYNWDIAKAITAPNQNKRDVLGWKRWKETAEINGVCESTYLSRVRLGWDQERAAIQKPKKRKRVM
jgi:hypothetical protein